MAERTHYVPGSLPHHDLMAGHITGIRGVNKFGRAPNGVQITTTDIWDLADATPTQSVYVAPTQARIHNIVSSSTSDDGNPLGAGARTIRIYGLTSWTAKEVTEDIIMNGQTNVPTVNAYVFIYRMQVLTWGGTSINVGTIKATAVTDTSISAVILPLQGQTQMAIYAFSSLEIARLVSFYSSINKGGGGTVGSNAILLINDTPQVDELRFKVKHTAGMITPGTSHFQHFFEPYFSIQGPAIIKVAHIATAADLDSSAGFDLLMETPA